MSHLFPRSYDSWRIGDAEREAQEGPDEDDELPDLDEAQCDACGAWVDDERLKVANADREKSVTCANPECQKEYQSEEIDS